MIITDPNTHDYRDHNRYWGHDIVFRPIDGGHKASASGWGNGLKRGDYILMSNGDGETRYKIDKIEYCLDPTDMWHADLSFAPRQQAGQKT